MGSIYIYNVCVVAVQDFRHGTKPMLITPSQSCESMHSIQSMPNVQYRQHAVAPPLPEHRHSTHLPGAINKSQTSLDRVLEDNTQDEAEDKKDNSSEVKEEKLIDFSPTDPEPKTEIGQEDGKPSGGETVDDAGESGATMDRRRCQSECLPHGRSMEENAAKRKGDGKETGSGGPRDRVETGSLGDRLDDASSVSSANATEELRCEPPSGGHLK